METEPYTPTMRLTCQLSIPVTAELQAKEIYEELKIFLQAISPTVTINGQVTMMLEPCCKGSKK